MENYCREHEFEDIEELGALRERLLEWYDVNKRELPWRTLVLTEHDTNIRAYGVWVSEIMLQQTQVATVIDYYTKWMKKWPTVESLSKASLEEVHAQWAGLGYYSRGERLWKGAKKVMSELGGVIPGSAEELMKSLPGVGRYTAGAIASIAFGKVSPIVDGNVVRVLCRQRAIGKESSSQIVTKHLWKLAEMCVDLKRPGDFNQALMELGATVCTPRNPSCKTCPLNASCQAYRRVKGDLRKKALKFGSDNSSSVKVEVGSGGQEKCSLCLAEWNEELGVANYPLKAKKKSPPVEEYCVAVIENQESQFLLKQRPSTGLLAGLWEFPSVPLEGKGGGAGLEGVRGEGSVQNLVKAETSCAMAPDKQQTIGTVSHQFSHVHHTYHCWHVRLGACPEGGGGVDSELKQQGRWVSREDLAKSAVPASVKKIMKLLDAATSTQSKKRCASDEPKNQKRQKTLSSFFKK